MSKKSLLAIVAMSAITFASCNAPQNQPASTAATPAETIATAKAQGGIVYVNMDSLISGYQHYIDRKASFDTKAEKVQKELENKTRSFERKVGDYQNKVQKGLVTRAEAADLEQKLAKEQQDVVAYRDKVLAELQEEEQVMFRNINNDIEVYIEKYNNDKKYDLIIATNGATKTVLIANPSLDITVDVLSGLNKDYSATK